MQRGLDLGGKVGPIISSRGCPWNCVFCFKAIFGRHYRRRSPQNVVAEMKWQINEFGVNEFEFLDDLFAVNRRWLDEFCEELDKNHINVPWRCHGRVNSLGREHMLKLREHGCYQIGFGVESGNDEILKDIKKNITTNQVRQAFEHAKEAGLLTIAYFMVGHRKDTHATIRQTVRFAKEIGPDMCGFGVLLPFPGSEVYSYVPEEIKYDWARYNSYYDRELLPISLCAVEPRDLRDYASLAEIDIFGNLSFLLRNVIFRSHISLHHRRQLLRTWETHAKRYHRSILKDEKILEHIARLSLLQILKVLRFLWRTAKRVKQRRGPRKQIR